MGQGVWFLVPGATMERVSPLQVTPHGYIRPVNVIEPVRTRFGETTKWKVSQNWLYQGKFTGNGRVSQSMARNNQNLCDSNRIEADVNLSNSSPENCTKPCLFIHSISV